VVVERDRRRVEELRAQGVPAVFGDATAPGILEAVLLQPAALAVAMGPHHAVDAGIGRPCLGQQPPRLMRVGRRDDDEAGVLMAERELALGMMTYALRSLGVREGEARLFVDSSRSTASWRSVGRASWRSSSPVSTASDRGMMTYALRSLGVREGEARLFVDSSRSESQGTPVAELHHPSRQPLTAGSLTPARPGAVAVRERAAPVRRPEGEARLFVDSSRSESQGTPVAEPELPAPELRLRRDEPAGRRSSCRAPVPARP
jgi:hypothetical protein